MTKVNFEKNSLILILCMHYICVWTDFVDLIWEKFDTGQMEKYVVFNAHDDDDDVGFMSSDVGFNAQATTVTL